MEKCRHRKDVLITVVNHVIDEVYIVGGKVDPSTMGEGERVPEHYELDCGNCGEYLSWDANVVPGWVLKLLNQKQ